MNRSEIMRSVRRKDTTPELAVRKALHAIGVGFRLSNEDLPGRPDIVLSKYRTVIFVHGCFWHRHPGCKKTTTPKTRQAYWIPKFEANVKRDSRQINELAELGWRSVVIWECETLDLVELKARLKKTFLDAQSSEHA